jgi:hypothetical protein
MKREASEPTRGWDEMTRLGMRGPIRHKRAYDKKTKPPMKIGGTTKNTSPTVMKIYRERDCGV